MLLSLLEAQRGFSTGFRATQIKIHGVYLGIISSCCIIICTEQDKKNIQSGQGIKRCSQSSPNNYRSGKWFPFITLNVNIALTAKPGGAELVFPLRVTAQTRRRSHEATGSIQHTEPNLKPSPLLWMFQPSVTEKYILPGKQHTVPLKQVSPEVNLGDVMWKSWRRACDCTLHQTPNQFSKYTDMFKCQGGKPSLFCCCIITLVVYCVFCIMCKGSLCSHLLSVFFIFIG